MVTTRKAKNLDPLGTYAQSAPSVIMRNIAEIAKRRGFNQERLATAYGTISGKRINGANVARHFNSHGPDRATIATYAKALGVSMQFFDLVADAALPEKDVDTWRSRLAFWLSDNMPAFTKGTIEAVEATLAASETQERRVLARFARGLLFDEEIAGRTVPFSSSGAFQELADALRPSIDLTSRVVDRVPRDGVLWDVYSALRMHFDKKEAVHMTDIVARVLEFAGKDSPGMWDFVELKEVGLLRMAAPYGRQPQNLSSRGDRNG